MVLLSFIHLFLSFTDTYRRVLFVFVHTRTHAQAHTHTGINSTAEQRVDIQ